MDLADIEKALSEAFVAVARKSYLYPNHETSYYDTEKMNEAKNDFVKQKINNLTNGVTNE